VLLLPWHRIGLVNLPEAIRCPGGFELRARRRLLASADSLSEFRCAYWLEDFRTGEERVFLPDGTSLGEEDFTNRQVRFLMVAAEEGFELGRTTRFWLEQNLPFTRNLYRLRTTSPNPQAPHPAWAANQLSAAA
jgi:hypothetical protein